ncbi:MAG TPA: HmuY family protein [Parafilimonas sp.]|nr:HmuY family protein [Parafilimonas sp.]
MKKHLLKISAAVFLLGMYSTSCKKDDNTKPETPLQTTPVKNIEADPALNNNHFVFYSLETNQQIDYTDSATTKWDVGFRSTTIIVNGGNSGPGNGGAFVQTGATFPDYTTVAADSAFKTDAAPAYAIPTGSGNGWYNYNFETNIISPIPGRLLVIRTANGKYAKVEILSYYKDAPASPTSDDAPRYYSFQFIYQPDGTTKLQ